MTWKNKRLHFHSYWKLKKKLWSFNPLIEIKDNCLLSFIANIFSETVYLIKNDLH